MFNNLACCFDAGDCLLSDTSNSKCPSCDQDIGAHAIGDGICQVDLNTENCCFDGGDCSLCFTCEVDLAEKIGDKVCHKDLNNVKCCFDGGDCEEYVWESKYIYKGVQDVRHDMIQSKVYSKDELLNYEYVSTIFLPLVPS